MRIDLTQKDMNDAIWAWVKAKGMNLTGEWRVGIEHRPATSETVVFLIQANELPPGATINKAL